MRDTHGSLSDMFVTELDSIEFQSITPAWFSEHVGKESSVDIRCLDFVVS